jgi:hypothetical protein
VGFGLGDVFGITGDYEAELAFVVGLFVLGDLGDYDRGVVVLETGCGFYEGGGIGRESTTSFFDYGKVRDSCIAWSWGGGV